MQTMGFGDSFRVFVWPRVRGVCALVLVIAVGIAASGCGKRVRVVPVSGRVTKAGQPLEGVAVNFAPASGGMDASYAAYGKTDKDGKYTLKLVDNGQPGALPGRNQVMLHESSGAAETDGAAPNVALKLPPKARDGTLSFEVPAGGTDAANFEF